MCKELKLTYTGKDALLQTTVLELMSIYSLCLNIQVTFFFFRGIKQTKTKKYG